MKAIEQNIKYLKAKSGDAKLCAVVKANGYGHGSSRVALTAIASGADYLAVAQTSEGIFLRRSGVLGHPIMLLSEPHPSEFSLLKKHSIEPTVYTPEAVKMALANNLKVHLKVDTGMRRVGGYPVDVLELAEMITPKNLLSVYTHLAVADEPDNLYTDHQLNLYNIVVNQLKDKGFKFTSHVANSAGVLARTDSYYGMVRTGIAIYGFSPSPAVNAILNPALRWTTEVAFTKTIMQGERVSYGLEGYCEQDSLLATIPIGYADGYRRGLWRSGEVLINGERCPIIGKVTMDQTMVVCPVGTKKGDEVVLLGTQGAHEITAQDLASKVDTIPYEILTGISQRVQREYINLPALA